MTTEHEASRTLVKSPPELWAECSVAESLARHLAGSFGEIRITRLEPETAVAWEGECVSGTVRIEPSGWGTRVTLTAQAVAEEPAVIEPEVVEEPIAEETPNEEAVGEEPPAEAEPTPPRRRLLERLRAFFRGPEPPVAPADPESDGSAEPPELDDSAESSTPGSVAEPAEPEPEPDPSPPEPPAIDPDAVLTAALDSLGQAHHRPFSRA
jgi:hypothetical protein